MLRTQDSKTQFAPRLKTLRLKTLDPGRAGRYVVSYSVAGCSVAGCSVAGCSVVMSQCGGWVQGRCESGWAASRACIVSQLEIRFRGLCGRSSCSDGRILRTLAACALTTASWLPAFTSAHSAPLSSKVPEPTLTTICSWAWIVHGTPSSSFTSHTPRDLDDTRARPRGKENFSRAKEQPKNCRRVAAAYGIADRG